MSVNISPDTSTVVIQSTANTVTVVDTANSVNVSTSQPITNVVTVAIPGPQGATGPAGAIPNTGSFAITGSNSFIGNQSIQGDLTISGSNNTNSALFFLGGASVATIGPNIDMTAGPGGWSELGSNDGQNYVWVDDTGLNLVTNWDGNTETSAWRIATGSRQLTAVGNLNMNGRSVLSASNLATTGSVTFTGPQIVTGSTRGNVTALSISSNTASINLSAGNFFTLQLVSGSNTYINPSNILPGQTSILTLSTTGSATVSWPSFVKQPSGSTYVPTTTTGVDIVTLASVDTSTLYVVNIKNMI